MLLAWTEQSVEGDGRTEARILAGSEHGRLSVPE